MGFRGARFQCPDRWLQGHFALAEPALPTRTTRSRVDSRLRGNDEGSGMRRGDDERGHPVLSPSFPRWRESTQNTESGQVPWKREIPLPMARRAVESRGRRPGCGGPLPRSVRIQSDRTHDDMPPPATAAGNGSSLSAAVEGEAGDGRLLEARPGRHGLTCPPRSGSVSRRLTSNMTCACRGQGGQSMMSSLRSRPASGR